MTTAHTPGPWSADDTARSVVVVGADGMTICRLRKRAEESHNDATVANANAKLIAAAPTLLEACVLAEMDMEEMSYSVVTFSAVREAIAKATGEVSDVGA